MAAPRDESLIEVDADETRVLRGFLFAVSVSVPFWLLVGLAAWLV